MISNFTTSILVRSCLIVFAGIAVHGSLRAADIPLPVSRQQAASRTVAGRVTDAAGNPLVGVSVIEEGTANGVSTAADGTYALELLGGDDARLRFSFIGYEDQELAVGTKSTIDVRLAESVTEMDNVVVIGYGTTTKKELTGSVSSLKSDNFKTGNITDPLQLLQGQVAGLNIVRAEGGDPNGGMEVQLRGMTTMAGGASPLVVIDGVVGGDLSNVSPEDIASIDVLKDGSAAAIYGTRGTNGVILVTTKKARSGENRIEFSAYVAMQSIDRKPDLMSAEEYRSTIRKYFPDQAASYDYGASTDWFDAITRTHPVSQNYSVASSGGSSKLNYRASVVYSHDVGLVKKTDNEKLRGRLNVGQSLIDDRLKIDYNFAYTSGKGSYADKFIMRQAVLRNPTEPIYADGDGDPQYGKYFYTPGIDYHNPVAMLEEREDEGIHKEFSGSINASLRIVEGLKVGAMAGLVESTDRYGHYYGRYYPVDIGNDGTAETFNDHYRNKMLEATIDYSGTIGSRSSAAIRSARNSPSRTIR